MYAVPDSQCRELCLGLKVHLTLCVLLFKEKFTESEAHVARLSAELEGKSVFLFISFCCVYNPIARRRECGSP
jgi:hypothetical protein